VSGQAVQGDARGQAPGRRPAPGPGRRARWRPADPVGLALRWLVLLVVAVAWQLATMGGRSVFFPPLTEVLRQALRAWLSGPASHAFLTPAVASDVVPSLGRLLGGWLLAVVAGVSVGTAVGLVRNLADYLDPVIEFVRAIPPPAMIPPFLVVLGLGSDMKIALIAVGVVWPILLNTIDGVRSVDPVLMDTGRTFRTGRLRRLVFIVLPSASPRIFAGLRVSLSLSLILMVISEMVAATGGIGFTIVQAERSFAIKQMWAGILLLGVLGYLLNSLLLLVERGVLAWHRGARGTQESA
jgi:ABC-type nitrate/sulfonate/bicarbonate transport system permease component